MLFSAKALLLLTLWRARITQSVSSMIPNRPPFWNKTVTYSGYQCCITRYCILPSGTQPCKGLCQLLAEHRAERKWSMSKQVWFSWFGAPEAKLCSKWIIGSISGLTDMPPRGGSLKAFQKLVNLHTVYKIIFSYY